MQVAAVIEEAAALAAALEDAHITISSRMAAEGVQAIQEAAIMFKAATDNAGRRDAALWLGEAYQLLSSGLPNTGSDEGSTGWATAAQISKLIGGPSAWQAMVEAEYD